MLSMLQAHGLEAGPTQRPILAGAVSGLIAALPALAVVLLFGSLDAPVGAIGITLTAAAIAYCALLLAGGLLYGGLFQRAANDVRGGWLLGLAFGFILWMLGPIPPLQWLPDEPILSGYAAAGLLVGQLLWGLSLGVVFPFVQRELRLRLDQLPPATGRTGPEAATVQRTYPSPSALRSNSS
jgi:hypothetical protein